MAAISSDMEVEVPPAPRNTRVNEIVAIALVALGLLLFLCLFSYNPNDVSWNAAGEAGSHNWIGAVGANVAAALFQSIGLAAYLLPFLFLAAAWRRFRSHRINAPVSRVAGLILLVLSSSALLALAHLRPFFDASFNAGGLAGVLISRALVSGLNTVGAAILLAAIAATGLLLSTRFSFALYYENLTLLLGDRFAALRLIPERFCACRMPRRERRQQRLEMRRQAKAEREVAGSAAEVHAACAGITAATNTALRAGGDEIAEPFASFSATTSGKH